MPSSDNKDAALRAHGALNPRPQDVSDELFQHNDFFDPKDLPQVKYEMLRRVRVDGHAVRQAADAHGLSRPTFYAARRRFEEQGLEGLLPRRRGPKGPHKLTEEVLTFLWKLKTDEGVEDPTVLAQRAANGLGVHLHPRTIQRVLDATEKKRP